METRIKTKVVTELNPFQAAAVLATKLGIKNKTYLVARGGGKSTVLGWDMMSCVRAMPRSTGILVGETYQQILSRTLPSTKEGLEMFGIYEGIDYVVGKKGPGYELPFQSPERWNNVIHFRNGTIVILVSLDMPDAGRGINSYWVIGDEAALLNKERLFLNVQTTNRAKKSFFEKCSLLNAEIFASSMPLTKKGKWLLEMENVYKTNPEYKGISTFLRAPATVNIKNLSKNWFGRMKANASSVIHYEAEILNIEPPSVLNGFYMQWSQDIHTYGNASDLDYLLEDIGTDYKVKQHDNCRQDKDLKWYQQLEISIDPGEGINSMTVWQKDYENNIERCIKEFVVKRPKDYEDLVKEFDLYYSDHKNRVRNVILRHDAQAFKERDKNNKLIADKIVAKLTSLGWIVNNMTPNSNNPFHEAKFTVLNYLLKGSDPRLPQILINKDNCPNTVISIEGAETEIKRNSGYAKDKSSERQSTTLPEHATHLSDTVDYHLYWKYADIISEDSTSSFFIPL